jgi:WD40 repeat protein
MRASSGPAIVIPEAHKNAVNSLAWKPYSTNILLSASFDRYIHIFDLRRPSSQIHSLSGHHSSGEGRVGSIYHPRWYLDDLVLTTGEKTKALVAYSSLTGALVSRLVLSGIPANIAVLGTTVAAVQGSHITLLQPVLRAK